MERPEDTPDEESRLMRQVRRMLDGVRSETPLWQEWDTWIAGLTYQMRDMQPEVTSRSILAALLAAREIIRLHDEAAAWKRRAEAAEAEVARLRQQSGSAGGSTSTERETSDT
jgi:hypothetical protein